MAGTLPSFRLIKQPNKREYFFTDSFYCDIFQLIPRWT